MFTELSESETQIKELTVKLEKLEAEKKEMADEKKVAEANKTKVNNFLNFPACF